MTALGIKGEERKAGIQRLSTTGVIMLVMVEKVSAELEAIYRRALIPVIIADSKPQGHSRIGVERTDSGWTWLTTSIDLAVLDITT